METDDDAEHGAEPASTNGELTPAQLAAIEAAKAAKKARKAQRKAQEQAERARRLAEEYARLAEDDAGPVSAATAADTGPAASITESVDATATDTVAEDQPAVAAVETAVAESAGGPAPAAGHRVPLVTATVALAACIAFAVAALIVFLTTGSSNNSDAATRDDVARLAAQDIKVLNTMDYRSVDEHLQRWADASTGTLHHQVVSATALEKQQIQKAQKIATADVKYQAITALDTADGTASVIASVDVTVKSTNGQSSVKRERLLAEMTRVGPTWRVSSLSDVPVSNP